MQVGGVGGEKPGKQGEIQTARPACPPVGNPWSVDGCVSEFDRTLPPRTALRGTLRVEIRRPALRGPQTDEPMLIVRCTTHTAGPARGFVAAMWKAGKGRAAQRGAASRTWPSSRFAGPYLIGQVGYPGTGRSVRRGRLGG